eukprot:GEMP01100594.1.p1 GENE.GEMP01100594.1~~GEMP01100594.1.p1  ORF type:complete len:173 (+),score=43.21 GEMP01100594.1:54-572(+)
MVSALVKLTQKGGKKVSVRKASKKHAPRIRKSLAPGTIVILLAGAFRGKRAVCLKQLASGTILVSGPYSVNGVPLRRVNPSYCVATSTKVNIEGVDLSSIDDTFFKRTAEKKAKKTEDQFFAKKATKELTDARKTAQQVVDKALEPKVKELKPYLKHRFSLSNGMYPHEMKF